MIHTYKPGKVDGQSVIVRAGPLAHAEPKTMTMAVARDLYTLLVREAAAHERRADERQRVAPLGAADVLVVTHKAAVSLFADHACTLLIAIAEADLARAA